MIIPKSYRHKDFSRLIRKKKAPETTAKNTTAEKKTVKKSKPKKPTQTPAVTEASRHRSRLLGNPEYRYVYNKKTKMYHDRDCVRVKYIADAHFDMVKDFPANEHTFCWNCYRKALIRAGIGPHTKWLPVASVVLDRLHAENYDLHRLFVTNHGSIVDVDWDQTAVCFQVGEDQWVVKKEVDGNNVLLHNNYEVVPSGERIFFDGFHLQEDFGGHSFKNHARIMCMHQRRGYEYEDNTEVREVVRALRRRKEEDFLPTQDSDTRIAYPWLTAGVAAPGFKTAAHVEPDIDHLVGLMRQNSTATAGERDISPNQTATPLMSPAVPALRTDTPRPRIDTEKLKQTRIRPKTSAKEIASENLLRSALGLELLEYNEEE